MRCERCGIDHHDTSQGTLTVAKDGRRVCADCARLIDRQKSKNQGS